MSHQLAIRPADRRAAKPLIGLYAKSGCGKTMSALLLARGFVGPEGRIIMIETEAGRGEAYEDLIPGGYDVIPLQGDFSPRQYGAAISMAEDAKAAALIIDSAYHEWEGIGGVLAQAAENSDKGKKGVLAWQKPKMDHQTYFMLRLMQSPIPLVIVCMRAKYPMEERPKPGGGKEWVRLENLEPKQDEDILHEMFVHGWIDKDHNFRATKYTRSELREIIRDGEPISFETGKRLAAWAEGRAAKTAEPAGIEILKGQAEEAASGGIDVLELWFRGLSKQEQRGFRPLLDPYKHKAERADREAEERTA